MSCKYVSCVNKPSIRLYNYTCQSKIFMELTRHNAGLVYFFLVRNIVRGRLGYNRDKLGIYNSYYKKGKVAACKTQREMADALGVNQSNISRSVKYLMEQGLLIKDTVTKGNSTYNVYILGKIVNGKEVLFLNSMAALEFQGRTSGFMRAYFMLPLDFFSTKQFSELIKSKAAPTYFYMRSNIVRKPSMKEFPVNVYNYFYKNGILATRRSQLSIAKVIGRHVHTVSEHYRRLESMGHIRRVLFDDQFARRTTRCACVIGEIDRDVVGKNCENGREAFLFDTKLVSELKLVDRKYWSPEDYHIFGEMISDGRMVLVGNKLLTV